MIDRKTKRRKLLLSISSNFSREVTTSLGQLLLTPLYISRFGATDYAIWLLLTAYSSFVVLADFGLSTAVIVKMKRNIAALNLNLWHQFMKFTFILALCISCLVFVLVYEYFRRIGHQFHNFEFYSIITLLFIILSFQTLRQHNYLYQMQMLDAYDKGMRTLFLVRICEISTIALALSFKADIFKVLITNIVLRELFFILTKSTEIRLKRLSKLEISSEDGAIRLLIKPAMGNGFIALSVILGIHGSFALAATWLDSKSLIALGLSRMLVSPVRLIAGSLLQGSLPHFIALESETTRPPSSRFFSKYLIVSILLIFSSAVCVILASNLIWGFLARNSVPFSRELVLWLMVSVIADALCVIRMQLPTARNQNFRLGSLYFFATVSSLFLQVLLSERLNLLAVPIAILVTDLFFLIITLLFIRRFK